MRKAAFAVFLAVSAVVVAWSQPKVAVLDAIIPQNMDPSVIVPATDKIIEKLVQSNRFTVLDRTNIESVLKEREFQVSGMVSDQDAVAAGKYLEADFIVIAKVSKVGDTFFISGKMINVKTGVIVSTTSAQGDGKLAMLIGLAGQVGDVLAGGSAAPPPAAAKEAVVAPPPEEAAPPPARSEEPQPTSGEVHQLIRDCIGFGLFYNRDVWTAQGDSGGNTYSDKISYNMGTAQVQVIAVKFIQFGIGLTWFNSATEDVTSVGSSDLYKNYTIDWLDFNFMFRVPIQLGHRSPVALVPMAGFECDVCITHKDSNGNDFTSGWTEKQKSDLNHFYFQLGFGIQIDVGSSVVVYPEMIYGFKVNSQLDDDIKSTWEDSFSNVSVSEGKLDLGVIVGFKI